MMWGWMGMGKMRRDGDGLGGDCGEKGDLWALFDHNYQKGEVSKKNFSSMNLPTSAQMIKYQHFTPAFIPTLLNLVATRNIVDKPNITPQKACRPVQPPRRMAPVMGFPTSRPAAMGIESIPIRTPSTPMWGHNIVARTVCVRETKVPEKKPYKRQKTIAPPVVSTRIQDKAMIVVAKEHTAMVLREPSLSAK